MTSTILFYPMFAQVTTGITPEQIWTMLISLTGPTLVAALVQLVRRNVPGATIVGVIVPVVGILIWLGSQYMGATLTGNAVADFVIQVLIGYAYTIFGAVKEQLSQGMTRTMQGIRMPVGFLGEKK